LTFSGGKSLAQTLLMYDPVHPVDDQTARIELTPDYAALVDQVSLWLLGLSTERSPNFYIPLNS
jgi:hypothetical protein